MLVTLVDLQINEYPGALIRKQSPTHRGPGPPFAGGGILPGTDLTGILLQSLETLSGTAVANPSAYPGEPGVWSVGQPGPDCSPVRHIFFFLTSRPP